VKLLRALQEGEIRPVGGVQNKNVDVRVITATNKDLFARVKEGLFMASLMSGTQSMLQICLGCANFQSCRRQI